MTGTRPGITGLFIVSESALIYFLFLQHFYFREFIGLRGVMVLFLSITALYFESGCYFGFSKEVEPTSNRASFFTIAKKYFPSLLLISFYTFLIFFFFARCLYYLVDMLAGHFIDSSKFALALADMAVSLVTIYVIPILYTHGSRGMESFYHAFIFLWDNIGRSRILFIAIVAETLMWLLFPFIPSYIQWPAVDSVFNIICQVFSSYLRAVIFLTALQLLMDEEGRKRWSSA